MCWPVSLSPGTHHNDNVCPASKITRHWTAKEKEEKLKSLLSVMDGGKDASAAGADAVVRYRPAKNGRERKWAPGRQLRPAIAAHHCSKTHAAKSVHQIMITSNQLANQPTAAAAIRSSLRVSGKKARKGVSALSSCQSKARRGKR